MLKFYRSLLSIHCLHIYFPLPYRLSEARSGWNLVEDPSHYPSILSVDFYALVLVIMACIGVLCLMIWPLCLACKYGFMIDGILAFLGLMANVEMV